MQLENLTKIIVNTAFEIHVALGPGLFESVYEFVLYHELIEEKLQVKRQVEIPVIWKNKKLNHGFRSDLIIENKVLIEIKSVEQIHDVHKKQVLTYLKLTGIRIGFLINFNESLIKNGITRIINGY